MAPLINPSTTHHCGFLAHYGQDVVPGSWPAIRTARYKLSCNNAGILPIGQFRCCYSHVVLQSRPLLNSKLCNYKKCLASDVPLQIGFYVSDLQLGR